MRRTCPFLLGALLIGLICLGGGPDHLDPLLGPATAWFSSWLPAGVATGQQTASFLRLGSRELAPLAAMACVALCSLFHRWSLLPRLLAFAGWSGAALLGVAVAREAGGVALAPGPLLAAGLAALMIGTLTRRASAEDSREHALSGAAGEAALMPALMAQSTAAILTFDCDGRIRSCNRAFGELFGYETGDLVGTSFGRLLEVPDSEQPRLFRRSDGPVRALVARRCNGQRFHVRAALSTLEWQGDPLRVAVLYDVSEVLAERELQTLSDDATGLCNRPPPPK